MVRELGGPGGRGPRLGAPVAGNAGGADMLPQPPPPRPEAELASVAFRSQFNAYLSRLAQSSEAFSTYVFKNFFQLLDEYKSIAQPPSEPQPKIAEELPQ